MLIVTVGLDADFFLKLKVEDLGLLLLLVWKRSLVLFFR
jgi:hypothetical protein